MEKIDYKYFCQEVNGKLSTTSNSDTFYGDQRYLVSTPPGYLVRRALEDTTRYDDIGYLFDGTSMDRVDINEHFDFNAEHFAKVHAVSSGE
jgi:hypothetical protein